MNKQTKTISLQEAISYDSSSNNKINKGILDILIRGVERKINKSDDVAVKLALEELIETLNSFLNDEIKNCRQEYDKTINILGEFDELLK